MRDVPFEILCLKEIRWRVKMCPRKSIWYIESVFAIFRALALAAALGRRGSAFCRTDGCGTSCENTASRGFNHLRWHPHRHPIFHPEFWTNHHLDRLIRFFQRSVLSSSNEWLFFWSKGKIFPIFEDKSIRRIWDYDECSFLKTFGDCNYHGEPAIRMKFNAVLSKAINVSDYQQPSRVKSSSLIRTVFADYECLAQIFLRYAHPLPPFNPNGACSLDETVLTAPHSFQLFSFVPSRVSNSLSRPDLLPSKSVFFSMSRAKRCSRSKNFKKLRMKKWRRKGRGMWCSFRAGSVSKQFRFTLFVPRLTSFRS